MGVLLLTFMVSVAALAGTDDILNDLAPSLKAQILSGATAEAICEIRVLEKEMKVSFKPGPPSSKHDQVDMNMKCSASAPAPAVKITAATDLNSQAKRYDWLWSIYGFCEYKKQLKAGLERAAKKLDENPDYGLLSSDELAAGAQCALSPSALNLWGPSQTSGSRCLMTNGSSSTALECFYKEECRFECGGGAKNFQMLGAYELFAGADGMNAEERRRFDRHYPNLATGKNRWPLRDGLESEKDAYDGIQIPKKRIGLSLQAQYGEYALTGYRVVVDTKKSYRNSYMNTNGAHGGNSIELSSNAIVVSTSQDAVKDFVKGTVDGNVSQDQVTGAFETDMKVLTDELLKLSYMGDGEGDPNDPQNWQAYDQIRQVSKRDAILNGTFRLVNPGNKIPADEFARDQASYAKLQKILAKPIYRDTKIYIHPHGVVSLAWAIIDKKSFHPEAQLSLWGAETAEDNQYSHFVTSRIEACLGK